MLAVLIALLTADPSPTPKPRPTPAPVLEGRVQGPDGKPIAGAIVVARSKTATWTDPPLSTTTDAAGSFRLPVKTGAAHDVWAHARGLAVAKRDDVRPGTSLLFRLENGGAIEGVVRNSSGSPVAGARVESEPNDQVPTWVVGAGTTATSTDRNGRFRLGGLDRRAQTVVAAARGQGRARRQGLLSGHHVELILVPGASITGVVVDAEGRPLPNVVVRLDAQQRIGWLPPPCTTDAKGGFAYDGVAPGTYSLVARDPKLGVAVSPGIEVGAEGEVRRDVILLPGVAVVGRLVDPEEEPVPGRVVVGELAGEPVASAAAQALSADAGTDGRFRIEGVPLGAAALNVTALGFGARSLDFEARPGPPDNDLGDVILEPGLRLRGYVRSRAGTPVPEARLYASQRIGMSSVSLQGTSDEAGGFLIGGLQPGRAHLWVEARGFAPLSTQAEAGASELDLQLDPAGSIAGTVVDAKGSSVPSFSVSADKGNYEGEAQDEFSPTDGRFVLEDVGEGLWTVSVAAPGHAPASVPDVAVRAGRSTDVGRVRLSRGATIRGQVVTADDSAVPGATIRADQPRPTMGSGESPTTSSDASGLFELTGVAPGTTDVVATHPGHAESRVRSVEVDAARITDVRIVLGRGGRVEGTARRRDGAPLAGTYVHVLSRDRGYGFDRRRGLVGTDGSFAIDRVPVGPMRVALMLPSGGGRSSSSASQDVEVRDGETVTVELIVASILVTGRVTRGEEPVAGARVNVRMKDMTSHFYSEGLGASPASSSHSGPERGTGLTDEAGVYQLLVDAPGPAWASVEAGSPPEQNSFPNIEVPDAESYTLDFALGSAPLSGIVVDAETNAALRDVYVGATGRDSGARRGSSTSGPDGRFRIEVEPGEYRLAAYSEGYATTEVDVSPGISGLSEIVLAMEKGDTISGRLVDARGHGVGGAYVTATSVGPGNGAPTMTDGHFRIGGLTAGSYTVFAEVVGLGFAVRPSVTAPAESVTLQLSPGGRARVRALNIDGSPAKGAVVRVVAVDGLAIQAYQSETTNAEGLTELSAPSGAVTLEARASKGGETGRVSLAVSEGQIVPAEITLKPAETTTR